jgi:hypothetical protein
VGQNSKQQKRRKKSQQGTCFVFLNSLAKAL